MLSSIPSQSLEEVANPKMYYEPVDEFALERARKTISDTLKEALENEIITKDEFTIMNPKDKNASKFYCNFKVHKQTEHGQIPVRPIISGSGAITEKISLFIEHHIKELSMKHPSYLQDTPHFLRVIEKLNKGKKLPSNSMLVTSDVTNAYGNIPQDDGSTCLKEALEEREDKSIPSDFLVKLMDLVQKLNIFEFHDGQLWKQKHGVAMGINPAPSFANIYMARRIDEKIKQLLNQYGENGNLSYIMLKRFLDDLFHIFHGTTKKLHQMYDQINKIHPTLKFTMVHTTPDFEEEEDKCNCAPRSSIPFLDTSLSIENGKIEIDLHKKDTDRNQYLMPSSCHPRTTTKSIPFSLSLRIIRICTKPERRDNYF